ncbi:hypothetical protein [Gandjariella thermophila]|uniref:Transposase IS4-like domain-containing protein n=1 Tax=Gandjariella thermophila TaxID=1931992 RepID=A0A4D4JJ64_9PSEU|nr:hypothetical protein [Gandjariella thermophila]GDY33947.1 hypothetical protein GTS_55800 [Gandjariella thermophila]
MEHTFRLFKQTLRWTRPKLGAPESADRWTWLILTVHTQLPLARSIVEDCRRPWEKPVTESRRLAPARIAKWHVNTPIAANLATAGTIAPRRALHDQGPQRPIEPEALPLA